jgi:predicted ATP-grasp superfamily ATP-dependent carboligase
MPWSVLVTDGSERAALATVRSLGRAGHAVHVCSSRERSLAGASRYCASETRLPPPLGAPDAFVDGLAALADRVSADILLPVTEASLLAVLPRRDRFTCVIPFPSADQFTAICDKALVLRSAAAHGIAVPKQVSVGTAAEAAKVDGAFAFPVVLKPSRSVSGPASARSKFSVRYAMDATAADQQLSAMPREAFPVLVQERIEGPGFAISMLVWDGELRAAFAHRRIREKPPSGGVSVLREGVPLDPELLRRSVALLGDFDWQGVAMVEFKLDRRTGTPYLMEINGRLWGSLQLAVDAGVDFPVLLVDAAMGVRDDPVLTYDTAVRTRWELGDLDHLLLILRRSPVELNLPPGSPRRLATVAAFVRAFGPGNRREVFRFSDPAPFLREAMDWLARRAP